MAEPKKPRAKSAAKASGTEPKTDLIELAAAPAVMAAEPVANPKPALPLAASEV